MFNDILYSIPDLYLLAVLCIFMTAISLLAIHFVRKYIPFELRYRDNAMLANMSGLISIIYGVLVGLTALYLINNITTTSEAVQREANATADFYRDTKWLEDPVRTDIQQGIKDYIQLLTNVEWPQMREGAVNAEQGNRLIEDMSDKLHAYVKDTKTELPILSGMLENIKNLYNARQQRIQMSHSTLNPAIWFVVLIGTFLMVGICCFYSMNYYLHLITTCAVSIMASAMIYLLISLDRPFQGEFSVDAQPFQSIYSQMSQ